MLASGAATGGDPSQEHAVAPLAIDSISSPVSSQALPRIAVALFSITIFVSASLLFLVQPMVARMVLPRLGGSPSVWNTCMVFFQTMLLLGYVYADLATRWFRPRSQAIWHVVLLTIALAALPFALGDSQPPTNSDPVWWLLGTMTVRVGPAFLLVATSAPLLQRWFSTLPIASAADPYFLYAASNSGSLLALIAYPLAVERLLGLGGQVQAWRFGFVILILLMALCALLVRRFGGDQKTVSTEPVTNDHIATRDRLWWVALTLVPSSLMLGVTTHISTDLAAVPLLWVIPLALYLATFVLAFSSFAWGSYKWVVRALPIFVLASLTVLLVNIGAWWSIALHLSTFFVCALVCHRELAGRRPPVRHLTEYYIWLSAGGMLGGILNALIAPQLFSTVLEFPLALAAAALLRPSAAFGRGIRESYATLFGLPVFVGLVCVVLWGAGVFESKIDLQPLLLLLLFVVAAAYVFANRPEAFGIAAVAIVGVIAFVRPPSAGSLLFASRSFFGVHRVVDAPDHAYHLLQHGVTTHGRQQLSAAARCEPTGYYHPAGPIGQLLGPPNRKFERVAVIGLGSGALACYSRPGSAWTIYEIDPVVERIARDPHFFTYLANSAAPINVVLGDGRLSLQRSQGAIYDVVVVDAFSSDAIPVHLLTSEAVALYFSRLAQDGVLAIHISNGYLNLEPVIGAIAREHGLAALANLDASVPAADMKEGRLPSHWVLLARSPEPLATLAEQAGWRPTEVRPRIPHWTDDYSNILPIVKF